MPIVRVIKSQRFTTIPNAIPEHKDLSLKAKGLLVYLLSRPDGWTIHVSQLAKLTQHDGISAITSGMHELVKAGYAIFDQPRQQGGKFAPGGWTIYEEAILDDSQNEPYLDFPRAANPTTENRRLLNTDNTNNGSIEKTKTPLTPQNEGNTGTLISRRQKRKEDTQEVLSYLNEKTGRSLKHIGFIPARLRDGYSIDDCKRVVDWLIEHKEADWKTQYLDHTTPFRPGNFDKYLDLARANPAIPKRPDNYDDLPITEQVRYYFLKTLAEKGEGTPSEEQLQGLVSAYMKENGLC